LVETVLPALSEVLDEKSFAQFGSISTLISNWPFHWLLRARSGHAVNPSISIGGGDQFLVFNGDKDDESQNFCCSKSGSENQSIASEMDEIRQVLTLSGGSRSESCSTLPGISSNHVVEIDGFVQLIGKNDFNCCSSLETVIFSSESQLREIDGFQHCTSLCRIEIPPSVETIKKSGFHGCTSLIEVIFSSDSHLMAIDGFQHCISLPRIEIPESVKTLGPHAFTGCIQLHTVRLAQSGLLSLSGFTGTLALRWFFLPPSLEIISSQAFQRQSQRPLGCDSRRIILLYPEDTIARHRKHHALRCSHLRSGRCSDESLEGIDEMLGSEKAAEMKYSLRRYFRPVVSSPPILPTSPIPMTASDDEQKDMILDTIVNLPILTFGDPRFATSLVLKKRIRQNYKNRSGHPKKFVAMTNVQSGNNPVVQCTLDSVVCMFAVRAEFHCRHTKHRSADEPFRFQVHCRQCGKQSSIHVEYSQNSQQLVVSTDKCCGHFFVGRIPPVDVRAASLLVTNPEVLVDHVYEAKHPCRVFARILLTTHSLTTGHRVLLQGWIESEAPVHHGIPISSRPRSLDDVLRPLHGRFWIRRDPTVRGHLEHASQGVITLIWLAPGL
jgi:hypothetical protein